MELLIGLVSGGLGGHVAAALIKGISQGPMLNTLAGIVGGLLAGSLIYGLSGQFTAASEVSTSIILSQIIGGAAGGGIILAIMGVLRNIATK